MFGYVIPDKPNMYVKDFSLFKAFYCGLCKSIGKSCGQLMRFTTNYDMTFMYVFYCAVKKVKVEISNETCILNPVKKKSIVKNSEVAQKIVNVNTLLGYYKLKDNVLDDNRLKDKAALNFFKKHYKNASEAMPDIEQDIKVEFERLFQLEKDACDSLDMIADPFGKMLENVGEKLFCEDFTQNIGKVLYNIGKWIYLVDAIDDIQEDFEKKRFNPFLINYQFESREKFLQDKQEELKLLLYGCYNEIQKEFDFIELDKPYEGVLTNILWYGLLQQTKDILGRTTKCKRIRL